MSQQSQGTNSSPADLPMKRKRGRPRKDESMVQGENMNAMPGPGPGPGPDSARKNKLSAGTSEKVEDDMVGQVVSGVIDGSFDAGYLLNVKVGDTDTQLRGVVFLPGRFVPITPANDVAPHVTMLQRKEIPIPACNVQTPTPGCTSQSKQCKMPPVDLRNLAPVYPGQVPPDELQSTVQIATPKQIAPVTAPPADNLPRNDTSLSLLRKGTPQLTSESGFDNSPSEQNSKHTAHFDNHALIDHIPSDKLQSGNLAAFSHQHVSVMVPLAENLPKNDMCPPLESKVIPQTSESVLDIPSAEHCMKQFLELKDREPVFPGQVPHLELHSAVSMALDSLSASVTHPLADNLAKNDTGPSLEKEVVTQLRSESGLVIPPSDSTQPVELKNQGAFPDQAPAFEIQSADPMELDNQHTSAIITLGDNSAKNDSGSSLEEKPLPQRTSVSGYGISSSIQDNTQVVKPNSNAPILSERVLSFGLQPGTYTTLDKQPMPTSDVVPLAEKLPEDVTGPSWEGKLVSPQTLEIFPLEHGNNYKQQPTHQETHFNLQSAVPMTLHDHSPKSWKSNEGTCLEAEVPQQGLLCGLGDQSASFMGQVKFDKVVQGAEVLQDFVSADLVKSSSNHVGAEPEPEPASASEPSIDMLLGTVGRVPEVQHQAVGSDFKLNALIHEEAKKPDIELTGE